MKIVYAKIVNRKKNGTASCHKFNVPDKMRAEPNASSGYAEAGKVRKDFNAFSTTT